MASITKYVLEIPMTDGLLDSKFILKLREEFTNPGLPPGQSLWDDNFASSGTPGRKQLIADDIARSFNALFMRLELGADPPTTSTTPRANSSEKIILSLLGTGSGNWPNDPSYPIIGTWTKKAFRRYEISAAMYIILSAFNSSGSGGEPSGLPPSLPA